MRRSTELKPSRSVSVSWLVLLIIKNFSLKANFLEKTFKNLINLNFWSSRSSKALFAQAKLMTESSVKVVLTLAPWALKHYLGLTLLNTTLPKEPREVHPAGILKGAKVLLTLAP